MCDPVDPDLSGGCAEVEWMRVPEDDVCVCALGENADAVGEACSARWGSRVGER